MGFQDGEKYPAAFDNRRGLTNKEAKRQRRGKRQS
jgi:hypothetical protein